MAISWLTVLQSVPWSEVISNAPKVAEGARKLWKTVSGKPSAPEVPVPDAQPALSPQERAIAASEARIQTLEGAVSDLHAQMLASSELIQALAEQNRQLIVRAETSRVRVLWLAVATAATGVIAVASLATLLARLPG